MTVDTSAQSLPSFESEQWYFWTDDEVRHFVYEFGSTDEGIEPVVVLHGGWGAEHSTHIAPLKPLSDRYRFVLYDQRGSLRSPAPGDSISLDRMVQDLEQLRQELRQDKLTLYGHSMGAHLAYAYLAAHPERVRALVLVGATMPVSSAPDEVAAFFRRHLSEEEAEDLLTRNREFLHGSADRQQQLIEQEGMVVPEEPPISGRMQTRLWRMRFAAINSCTGENWRHMRGGQAYYSPDVSRHIFEDEHYAERVAAFWPALKAFEGPVRIIMGSCDYLDMGPTIWPVLVDKLQDGRLRVIEDAGHGPWLDKPEEYPVVLDEVLVGIQSGDAARAE